jgi:SAM-dependent methyltransferase
MARASITEKFSVVFEGDRHNRTRFASPGSQYIIQLLKGGYLGEDLAEGRGRKALDVGCGNGFNCVSLGLMGWHAHGVDISERILKAARVNLGRFAVDADLQVGENSALPYDTATFDLLLSINVIHYAARDVDVKKAIAEYARVMKPGATLVLLTNHPRNWILKGAERRSGHIQICRRQDDFRFGEPLFVFEDARMLRSWFAPLFNNIRVGSNQQFFIGRTIRHFVLTANRREDSGS